MQAGTDSKIRPLGAVKGTSEKHPVQGELGGDFGVGAAGKDDVIPFDVFFQFRAFVATGPEVLGRYRPLLAEAAVQDARV